METPSNPLFSNDLNEYEQYLVFLGYMDRVHEEMCKKSGENQKEHQVDGMLMAIINKKVVGTLFPDGKYDMEHLKYLGDQMTKLHLTDRVEEIKDEINQVTLRYRPKELKNNPELIRHALEELFR